MGLSFFGGLFWLAALLGSVLWPALLAWWFANWRRRNIADREKFLRWAIPAAYVTILGLHALLGPWVRSGAEAYATSSVPLDVWGPVIAVLLIENAAALLMLQRLQRIAR